jgi:hypothetical protein
VVTTVVLEEAGFGSEAAAPVVRRLLELVSDQKELPHHPTTDEVDDPAAAYDRIWADLWNEDPDADLDEADTGEEADTEGSSDGTER